MLPALPLPGRSRGLDLPGQGGAGWPRSRAAGQPVVPFSPRAGRDPGKGQHGAAGRRPGPPTPSRRR
jgi:hypothetical protein